VLSACNKIEPLVYQWIDQYLLCSQEQAEAKDLIYFWTKAAECKQEGALKSVLAVRASTSPLPIFGPCPQRRVLSLQQD
jgi:hypothetical protein